jgi:acetyltransferase-like isoleucine patch superfamily enzyme
MTSDLSLTAIYTELGTRVRARAPLGSWRLDWAPPPELERITDGLPSWWLDGGNVLYARAGAALPILSPQPGLPPPVNARVVLGCGQAPAQVVLWGGGGLVVLGDQTRFPEGQFFCGDGATIAVGDRTVCTWSPSVDSRNGGLVYVGPDGLWATRVQMNSDDMHAIRTATGARINPYGGQVLIDAHVWLGYEALLLSGAEIGADSVVGARAVVRRSIPPNSVCAGVPASVVRTGVTWCFEDLP